MGGSFRGGGYTTALGERGHALYHLVSRAGSQHAQLAFRSKQKAKRGLQVRSAVGKSSIVGRFGRRGDLLRCIGTSSGPYTKRTYTAGYRTRLMPMDARRT